jgi:hypothetical protein
MVDEAIPQTIRDGVNPELIPSNLSLTPNQTLPYWLCLTPPCLSHVRHRQNNEFLSGSSSSSSSRPSSFSTIFTALPWSSRPSCSRLDFFFDHLIPPLGDEICDFLQFFRIFWTPNGQKRLVSTASTRGPIRSRHVDQSDRATSLSRVLSPRQCLASLSPPSRPPLARADAPARARARRYRPLSPGASAVARQPSLARLSPTRGR